MILIYDRFGFNLCVSVIRAHISQSMAQLLFYVNISISSDARDLLHICRWCQEIYSAILRFLPCRFSGTTETVLIYWCW